MAIDNPQNIEKAEQNATSVEPDLEIAAADIAEVHEGSVVADSIQSTPYSAEPPARTTVDSVQTSGERRGPWGWIAAGGAAAVAAIVITVAAVSGGGDSKPKKAATDPTEETAADPATTQSTPSGNETATQFSPIEILPTVEKTPEEKVAAHIKLQLLAENTMSGDLMPYVFYDTDPSSNSYMQDTLELIHEIREGRGRLGPVGVYSDGDDGIESVSAIQVPGGPLGDDISAEVAQRDKVIQWEPDQKSFVEYVQLLHYRVILRQKIVNGRTYWTQYSYEKLSENIDLSSQAISREEADVPFNASFKQLKALENNLGIEYVAAPEPT